ncbi:Formation of crista junctions protein 1 [Leucoagaricus sp. SymC.cos]|nr:Formation of crista junctions protein 1 [Leucoagaricus sp. SymC.cos]
MYCVLPVTRQAAASSGRNAARIARRRLATEAAPTPKKKGVVRKVLWTTATATGTFYVGSTFVAFNNQTYYDLFSEHVPLGRPMLEYAEAHGWDNLTVDDVIEFSTEAFVSTYSFMSDLIKKLTGEVSEVKEEAEKKEQGAKAATTKAVKETPKHVEKTLPSPAKSQPPKAPAQPNVKVDTPASAPAPKISLVARAEAAIAGKPYPGNAKVSSAEESKTPAEPPPSDSQIYSAPLPIGFEPPPGFSRPPPPKKVEVKPVEKTEEKKEEIKPDILPLVTPAVSSLAESEPIISHLAGTIDNLASYLATNPGAASKATDVLETAKKDLTSLADRFEKVREDERLALEAKLDEQTREYSIKLLELELEAQDKLDSQQEDFKKVFDEERIKIIQAYREKLENELRTQTELINERLKEEVIAQGIELQRRWIRDIKVRVEQERGGRLAKLDELSADLKRLERIALDNANYLDDNIRIHALWSAFRALNSAAISSPVRKPFRRELRVLRHIAAAREDPVVSAALDSLEKTDVPDVGIEPFADLSIWFTSEVSTKISEVALVPDENAGVLSYLASRALSGLRFKRHGLVAGDDVLSVLARAEYYLNEKDLDGAARELNQLKGPAKVMLQDWLEAARRRLEVQQALDVVQTQATLASLLVV